MNQFTYTFANLNLYIPSVAHVMVAILIGIIFMVLLRMVFEYLIGVFLVRHDKKMIEDKKQVLNDLILMKDIQTELEHEIEQATLKTSTHR